MRSSTRPDHPPIDESSVIAFLQQHPDFFLQQTELLAELELPHIARGAVSLVERQVAVLRAQRQELKQSLQQLSQTARDNELLLERIKQLTLALLELRGREAIERGLQQAMLNDFQADAFALKDLLLDDDRRLFARLIERAEPVCGHIVPEQKAALFSERADALASGALIPLLHPQSGDCFAVIGIGSADAQRFHAAMATTFLSFLGAVVARLLQRDA